MIKKNDTNQTIINRIAIGLGLAIGLVLFIFKLSTVAAQSEAIDVSYVTGQLWDLVVNQVFGDIMLAGLGILVLMIGIGLKMNWPIDTMIMVIVPLITAFISMKFLHGFIEIIGLMIFSGIVTKFILEFFKK